MLRLKGGIALTILGLALAACGNDTDFGGSSARSQDAIPQEEDAPVVDSPGGSEPYAALTWFWQCEGQPTAAPTARKAEEIILVGEGPHKLAADKLAGTKVTIAGKLCEPPQLPRDIVFVIDNSGSMFDNDPRIGDSCGRLAAIKNVVASIPSGNARFGLATFSTSLELASSQMFASEAELFADIAPTGNIADVVCNQLGGTNYDAGLAKAGEILQAGRENATKEVYFISDGQPNIGQDGVAIATQMKSQGIPVGQDRKGVTIATLMLAGIDSVLENFIASRDSKGRALHAYVKQTTDLTKALTALAVNEVVGGELKYRGIGRKEFTVVDIIANLQQGFNFQLPSFSIDLKDAPRGLEMVFEYYDRHENRYQSEGKIIWGMDSASLSD